MYLEKIEVSNFRMLKDVTFNISDTYSSELTLIVGKNNTGKTSILKILEKMIPGSRCGTFVWYDFSMEYQREIFSMVKSYEIDEDKENNCSIKLILHIGYTESDSYDIIRPFLMDLDEENNTVILECSYVMKEDNIYNLKRELKELKILEFDDFALHMRKNVNKYFKLEYNAISKCREYKAEIKKEELKKLIRLKSIQANRDISNKTSDHSLSNISDRLYNLIEEREEGKFREFQSAIRKTDDNLTYAYSNIFESVLRKVKKFGASNDSEIEILSTIEEKDLLKNNTTLFYNKNDVYLPESYNGLGYLNLIGMIFEIEAIASEFEKENLDGKGLNILFIEEPEAHTHPQLQYVFIKNIKSLLNDHLNKNIQTLMTTHSSHIVSECEFDDVIYLYRKNSNTKAKAFLELKKMYKDDYTTFEFIKKYLKLTRAELFFADKAILIEGDTERILMRSMIEQLDENSSQDNVLPLSSQNISVVEVGAHAHIFKHLLNFLGVKTLIITDIDYGKKDKRISKCDYEKATHTSNVTIQHFLGKKSEDLEEILCSDENDKIKGNCRIAYQTSECGIRKDYIGRSFEEAFININFECINKYKDKFQSMKNRKNFLEDKSPFELAELCIDKKTSFATDILFYGKDEWTIPKYIEEGLKWLRKD